jgi:type IV pilus assembly protein PilN
MLEINLLPVREARRKADVRQQLMQLLLVLLLTLGAIGIWHSRVAEQISMSEVRVSQMQNDIKQFKPQLDQVAAFKQKKARLEKKIDVIDGLDRARSGPVHVMHELAKRTPQRLWLTGLDSKGGEIRMEGRSLDNELVALFLRGLGESKYFDKVDLDSTQIVDGRDGLKVVKFAIRAQVVNPDAAAAKAAAKPAAPAGPATPPPAAPKAS